MMAKQLIGAIIISILALQAHGWWDTGHMLVAEIAWKHLTREGAATPETLIALKNAVDSLVTYSEASNTFVTAATWMDDLKTRNLSQFNNWHYINLPICQFNNSNSTDSCNGVSINSVLFSDDEDALWAIKMANYTITGNSALGFERGFALRNLLHIVGDLHQPLHAVARYAAETPDGDEGGNLFPIKNISFTKNLHGFWDSGLGMLNNNIVRPLNQSDSAYLSNLADSLIAFTANLTQNLNSTNVTEWALQSRALAIQYAYDLPFDSAPSQEYITQGWDIVQQQLGLGGYRLYLLLRNFYPCNEHNCPVSEKALEKKDNTWFTVGIALAVILGISFILNIILYTKVRRAGYDTINHH